VDGGENQQGHCHQAEGRGGDQSRGGVGVPSRHRGRPTDGVLAACAHEARRALAHGAGEVGVARAAVVAGEPVAGAGAHGAVLAAEAQCARAAEGVDAVGAGARVAAGAAGAVVDVGLAAGAGEADPAAAHDTLPEVQTLSACRGTDTGRRFSQNTAGRRDGSDHMIQLERALGRAHTFAYHKIGL